MWLIFALVSPMLWALVHVADSHCVHERFEKPWMGVTTSSFASLVAMVLLPFLEWSAWDWNLVALAILGGALIQVSQALYFQTLAYSEAGIVAAYWNMVPALLPVVSFILLSQVFSASQYAGIVVIVAASVCMCLLDCNLTTRWQSFLLMLTASVMQVMALLMLNRVYDHMPFLQGFLLMTGGIVVCGCLPLLLRPVRSVFYQNARALVAGSPLFVSIEIVNLLALACSQKALQLGDPSLVAAVESTLPAFCFILSMLFWRIAPVFGDEMAFSNLRWKFVCVTCMAIGVVMLP